MENPKLPPTGEHRPPRELYLTHSPTRQTVNRRTRASLAALAGICSAVVLTACGNSEADSSKTPGQVAAKVNSTEISVHQVNYALQRTPGVTSENSDTVSRQVLERLINQELAIQKAQELKLDRTPSVVQALENARREVLARAYFEKLGDGVAKPTAAEISEFYAKRPALFRERRIFQIQEANVIASATEIQTLKDRVAASKSPADFFSWLRGSGLKHQVSQGRLAAENLPLDQLDRIAALQDGQGTVITGGPGAKVVMVVSSERAPVDEATARKAIEQFILNDRRRVKVEEDIKAVRSAAKVELVGRFAQSPGTPPASTGGTVAPSTTAAASAPSGLSADAVSRGLGLK
jgi:EpsD family peptidyl-prolyl cis-trans isomerase